VNRVGGRGLRGSREFERQFLEGAAVEPLEANAAQAVRADGHAVSAVRARGQVGFEEKVFSAELFDAAGPRALPAIRVPRHHPRKGRHIHRRFRRQADGGVAAGQARVGPVGHVAGDAVAAIPGFKPQFLRPAQFDMHRAGGIGRAQDAAVKPQLAVHENAEADTATAAARLQSHLGIKRGILAFEQDGNSPESMMSQAPGVSLPGDLERRAGSTGRMRGSIFPQLTPGLADLKNQLHPVAQVFNAGRLGQFGGRRGRSLSAGCARQMEKNGEGNRKGQA